MAAIDGAYDTRRAASLAGIPVSTLYYWARSGIWAPTVPNGRPKLWSYSDLLAIRLINWLRKEKPDFAVPSTRMNEIRRALDSVDDLGSELKADSVKMWIDEDGHVFIAVGNELFKPLGVRALQGLIAPASIDLVAAFDGSNGINAPDLAQPRPSLRIRPGKLSSEPHVEGTRVGTQMLMAVRRRGLPVEAIVELYSFISVESVQEAISLEAQLERNLAA